MASTWRLFLKPVVFGYGLLIEVPACLLACCRCMDFRDGRLTRRSQGQSLGEAKQIGLVWDESHSEGNEWCQSKKGGNKGENDRE